MIELLNESNIEYSSFNILSDEEVRQGTIPCMELFVHAAIFGMTGLKKFSDWPTYPQLYSNGELVGGLDIVKEMKESETLDSLLPKQEPLNERQAVN